jgi:hypothetical protein
MEWQVIGHNSTFEQETKNGGGIEKEELLKQTALIPEKFLTF